MSNRCGTEQYQWCCACPDCTADPSKVLALAEALDIPISPLEARRLMARYGNVTRTLLKRLDYEGDEMRALMEGNRGLAA